MKVDRKLPFVPRGGNVIPMRKRLGLMGLGDDFTAVDTSAPGYAAGAAPQDVYNAVMANTGDPNLAASATGAYAAQQASLWNAVPNIGGTAAAVPGASATSSGISPTTANLITALANIGAGAYVQSGQTAVGIAPPGYTYRGYASNLTYGYGNLAPPGYSNAGIYANGYPYQAGAPYGSSAYMPATGMSTNTLLLLGGLALIFAMSEKKDGKKK